MDDIDAAFSDLLGEIDLMTQSLGQETTPPASLPRTHEEVDFSIGFTDLNESLNTLEDNDLDTLMADLVADLNATEEKLAAEIQGLKVPSPSQPNLPPPPRDPDAAQTPPTVSPISPASSTGTISIPSPSPASPPPPPQSAKPSMEEIEAQMKADKIKLALEKLKEAKVKKLVVKVLMNNGSSKTIMVDERQSVREVLDNLFEKTHCDGNVDWSLCEINADLQLERAFEDHENLVESLLAWTRDTENQIVFQERPEKYEVFKMPQNFYLWRKSKSALKAINDKDKEILIQENFGGTSVIVPDLEGVLHLKEDGKKSWKQRHFQLRASGIYYVPKGKGKSSRDLVCFVQFDNMNVYYAKDFKSKYKAPSDYCFILKHPQIQKDSQYIKYLCCDDARTMNLWVTGIRIAKYGALLYKNYQAAKEKAAVSSAWTIRSTSSPSAAPTNAGSTNQANGHAPKPTSRPVSRDIGNDALPPPPPPLTDMFPPPPPDSSFPPPPPPPSAKATARLPKPTPSRDLPTDFPPPPALHNLPPPPPPVDDNVEDPPDFLPPPPPISGCGSLPPPPPANFFPPPPPPSFRTTDNSALPPPPPLDSLPPPPSPPQAMFTSARAPLPPPPPPAAPSTTPRTMVRTSGSIKKVPPAPPKRTTPSLHGGGGEGGNLMSELMLAMQKKRSDH